ncbi:MAG: polysaccharide biosynthesis C-terminal domain-containing protein, partial [Methanoregula sp.]|nr:polysaccharide biosynthesis C-terminal domain-containing protein [Methanoregula sp.]
MGITGAAVATLIAIAVNAIGAYVLLSRVISIKIEYQPLKNILYAAGVMGVFLFMIPYLLPLSHIALVLATVITGAGIYALVLLKLDREIHDEIMNIGVSIGVPWPAWL